MYFACSYNYGCLNHFSVQFLQPFYVLLYSSIFKLLSFWSMIISIRNVDGTKSFRSARWSDGRESTTTQEEKWSMTTSEVDESVVSLTYKDFMTQFVCSWYYRFCDNKDWRRREQDVKLFSVLCVSQCRRKFDVFLIPEISMSRKLIRPSVRDRTKLVFRAYIVKTYVFLSVVLHGTVAYMRNNVLFRGTFKSDRLSLQTWTVWRFIQQTKSSRLTVCTFPVGPYDIWDKKIHSQLLQLQYDVWNVGILNDESAVRQYLVHDEISRLQVCTIQVGTVCRLQQEIVQITFVTKLTLGSWCMLDSRLSSLISLRSFTSPGLYSSSFDRVTHKTGTYINNYLIFKSAIQVRAVWRVSTITSIKCKTKNDLKRRWGRVPPSVLRSIDTWTNPFAIRHFQRCPDIFGQLSTCVAQFTCEKICEQIETVPVSRLRSDCFLFVITSSLIDVFDSSTDYPLSRMSHLISMFLLLDMFFAESK